MRDLLACNMEGKFALERFDIVEEAGRIEVIGDISSSEGQLSGFWITPLCLLLRYLRIFNDAIFVVADRYYTDRFGGRRLGHDFRGTVGLLGNTIANEYGICDANEAVIDAVGVQVQDFSSGQ